MLRHFVNNNILCHKAFSKLPWELFVPTQLVFDVNKRETPYCFQGVRLSNNIGSKGKLLRLLCNLFFRTRKPNKLLREFITHRFVLRPVVIFSIVCTAGLCLENYINCDYLHFSINKFPREFNKPQQTRNEIVYAVHSDLLDCRQRQKSHV